MEKEISRVGRKKLKRTVQLNLRVLPKIKEVIDEIFEEANEDSDTYISRGRLLSRIIYDYQKSYVYLDGGVYCIYENQRKQYSRKIWDKMSKDEKLDFLEYAKDSFGEKSPVIFNHKWKR